MSQYAVITPEGKRFGPTDFQTLSQWAREGRIAPGMMVEDLLSGQTMAASAVPGLVFDSELGTASYTRPPAPLPANYSNAALILGIVGLVAWCFPIVGFPIGICAVVFGAKSRNSPDRTKAMVAIVLGVTCLLFCVANMIASVALVNWANKLGSG